MATQFRRIVRRLMLVVGVATLGVVAPGGAPAADGENPMTAISQSQPGFYVRASCDHESRIYYEGDSLSIKLKCEADAFIYAIYQQADGKKYQIFPNSGQPNNRVKAGEEVVIPGKDDAFRWTVTAPFGKEQILVVASKEPLKILTQAGPQQSKFAAVSNETVKGAGLELDQQAARTWTEHLIEITTAERPAVPLPPAGSKRVGLFVGIGQYQWGEKAGVKNLRYPVSDATLMRREFQELGGIAEQNVKLLADQSATKAEIKKAINEWLPANTRPGDTVFIYFSGHAGQILDEPKGQPGHDEIDEFDENLATHDLMSFEVFGELLKSDNEGKLDPDMAKRVHSMVQNQVIKSSIRQFLDLRDEFEKVKDLPDNDPRKVNALKNVALAINRADSEIARETGICDDEFGHWLQKLDGRQVIVILDACQSAGFAKDAPKQPLEKDLTFRPAKFLDSAILRLKDIGQRDVALFAAAPVHLGSLEGPDTQGGIMTHFLAETMKNANGPLTLQQAYDQVKAAMARYFATHDLGKHKPHEPQLFNECTKMPVLRY